MRSCLSPCSPKVRRVAAPSLDTYYLFRRRICDFFEKTGRDLMQECFEQVTGSLVKQLKISGKSIRMDSKLLGSNIARQSRYELIHTTLAKFLPLLARLIRFGVVQWQYSNLQFLFFLT